MSGNIHRVVSRRRSLIALATMMAAVGVMYFGAGLPPGEATLEGDFAHRQVDCSTCHKMQANIPRSADQADLAAMPSSSDCLQCHQSRHSKNKADRAFHVSESRDCLTCHSFHNAEELKINGATGSLRAAKAAIDVCADCHSNSATPEVSPGHRLAAQLIHAEQEGRFAEKPSEFCLMCHNRDGVLPVSAPELSDFPRFHIQASHTFGETLVPGSGRPGSQLKIQDEFPADMPLFAGKMECQTCHTLVSTEYKLLTKSIESGLCNDCHDMGDRSAAEFVISAN